MGCGFFRTSALDLPPTHTRPSAPRNARLQPGTNACTPTCAALPSAKPAPDQPGLGRALVAEVCLRSSIRYCKLDSAAHATDSELAELSLMQRQYDTTRYRQHRLLCGTKIGQVDAHLGEEETVDLRFCLSTYCVRSSHELCTLDSKARSARSACPTNCFILDSRAAALPHRGRQSSRHRSTTHRPSTPAPRSSPVALPK